MKSRTLLNWSLIALFFVTISGCGMWTNFKTYFNSYYNANKIFQETEEKILAERIELFSFEETAIPNNLSRNLDDVIEKTSSILQHNKESDYVGEALIMTGKSFYYQQNYSRALRKFNELATLKESELLLENKLWIARTRLQMRDFTRGLQILDETKKEIIENEEDELLVEVYKTKISYLLFSVNYEDATTEMDEFLTHDIDDELRAEVLYEKGLLNKLSKDFELAEKAFIEVEEFSPSFEIEFKSKFEVAKIKGELGDIDQSLVMLENLRAEDKYSDNWDKLDLEIGNILYDKNEIEKALDRFTEVDTTYKSTESAGIAGFYRAEILENFYKDYDSALVFYKSAASSKAPRELQIIAQKKSRLLTQYILYHTTLSNLGTQLLYLNDEEAFRQDSLDYVEKIRLDSIKTANEFETETRRRAGQRQAQSKYKEPKRPTISADSIHSLNSKNYFELANLLFTEFDNPDSAFIYYERSLEEKPENPNQAQTYFAIGNYYLIKEDTLKADSMFTLVYDKYEFDPIRNEAAKLLDKPLYDFNKDPVEDEYNVAEGIYNSSKYDEAIDKLFSIYKDNPKSIYASKSLYTIGYILENNLNLTDSAAVIYDILNKQYRTSEYAKSINRKLAGYQQEQKRLEAIQDSIDKANAARLDSIKAANEINLSSSTEENADSTQTPTTNNTSIDSVNSAILTEEDPK
jgi:tetratricopeptide (TPR) repeat protein